MTVYEQTDGFEPNKQTPPSTTKLGASDNVFSEVHATSGNFNNLVVGSTDKSVAGKHVVTGVIPANTNGLLVTHNLANAYPVVQVYDSSGSGILMGSGAPGSVTGYWTVESSGANTLYLYADVAMTGANIVVIG